MRICIFGLIFFAVSLARAQNAPVKWATQETFFLALAGKDLPFFKGLTIDKIPFNSDDLKSKIVVINFWFEQCPPCIAEMPELNKLFNRYHAKGIRFIALTYDLPEAAKRFQKKNGYKYEIVSLSHEEIAKLNINHGFPSNILVGKNGKILYATAGISFSDDLPGARAKSVLFEEMLKTEIAKAAM